MQELVIQHYYNPRVKTHSFVANKAPFSLRELEAAQVVDSTKRLRTTLYRKGQRVDRAEYFFFVNKKGELEFIHAYPYPSFHSEPNQAFGGQGIGAVFHLKVFNHLAKIYGEGKLVVPDIEYGTTAEGQEIPVHAVVTQDFQTQLQKAGVWDAEDPFRKYSIGDYIRGFEFLARINREKQERKSK